ncbi:MAG TPA: L-threonylcarbamoyladenylate synthase [Gemmataceae bacterium]|nr:L-threonylcarbamoyladenylate synthase [Gemmataceae bacterium]
MLTKVLPADAAAIAKAAAILRGGGLVAFPTETVYGLGANALDERAVAGIFAAKGRPSNNPLIVHVADVAEAAQLSSAWPASAKQLADAFWPGPLTLVVPASPRIPSIVTAGGSAVALRVPAHMVAQSLLRFCGLPLAAPSANRSSSISPTRAEHVLSSLEGRIPMILDGGPTPGGLESTVLDLTVSPPALLRPGLVTPSQIEAVIGPISRQASTVGMLKSPGMLARHYAPRTPLECVAGDGCRAVQALVNQGLRVGWLPMAEQYEQLDVANGVVLAMPLDPSAYAAQLYAALHTLDVSGVERIVVTSPPMGDEWLAVHDRLRRASTIL